MAAAVGLAAQASLGTQSFIAPSSSGARRGRSRCSTCSAVAEPPPRLARAAVSSSDQSGNMDSRSAAGGMFCIWNPPAQTMHHASGFGRAAQTAPPAQRQVSAAIEALAGVFTDGPVSTGSEQEAHVAERWRYQGLRL